MGILAKDIAEQLGISPAAVSMAINDKPGVSESTRKRVLNAAREMGYDMSRVKKHSATKGRVAFILYKKHGAVVDDTQFFSDLTEGVLRACREQHYVMDTHYILDIDSTHRVIRAVLDGDTSGILLLGTEMRAEDFGPFQDLPIPIVVMDTYFEGLNKDCVLINNVQGAYTAAKYLISKHRGQPGYLRSSYSICNFEERADGFYKAIREHGFSASRSIVHRLAPSLEGAYADMRALLKAGEKIASCYFADNDLIAAGAVRAFKEAGYRIPEDIGIVGFDNTAFCELIEPPLTTVNVPRQSLGHTAVARLLDLIPAGGPTSLKIEVQTNLVKRRSL